MSESMFEGLEPGAQSGGEKPVEGQQTTPPAPGGEQQRTDGPQTWETVDDFVKALAGGKYQKPEDAIKGYSELSKAQQDALAKAKALEAKLGGHKGAPVDAEGNPVPYEFQFPEYMTETDELLIARANEIGRKYNASQEMMQDLLNEVYGPSLAAVGVRNQATERTALVESFGTEDAANEVLSSTFGWLTSVLPEDAQNDVKELGSIAAGVRVAHMLQKAFNSVQLPDGSAGGGLTWEQVSRAMTEKPGHPDTLAMERRFAEQEAARRKQAGTL